MCLATSEWSSSTSYSPRRAACSHLHAVPPDHRPARRRRRAQQAMRPRALTPAVAAALARMGTSAAEWYSRGTRRRRHRPTWPASAAEWFGADVAADAWMTPLWALLRRTWATLWAQCAPGILGRCEQREIDDRSDGRGRRVRVQACPAVEVLESGDYPSAACEPSPRRRHSPHAQTRCASRRAQHGACTTRRTA